MHGYYYLLCLLPPLPEALGEKMRMTPGEITGAVRRNVHPEHLELARALLYGVDAFNWEQADQGRDLFLEGGLVSRQDLADNRNLPAFIRAFRDEWERGIGRACPYDRLWELYYGYAHAEAERFGCRFLVDYLSWEIQLRSSLAAVRIRERGGHVDDHAVLDFFPERDFSTLVMRLKGAGNPLEAERLVDEERLRQIDRCEGGAGFSIDALLAYVARSRVYSRWESIAGGFDIETYLWHGGSM